VIKQDPTAIISSFQGKVEKVRGGRKVEGRRAAGCECRPGIRTQVVSESSIVGEIGREPETPNAPEIELLGWNSSTCPHPFRKRLVHQTKGESVTKISAPLLCGVQPT
jgi:hypothetical protein